MRHCILSACMCYVTLRSVCRHVLCDIAFCLQACTMWHCVLSAGKYYVTLRSVCRHVLCDIAFCLQACAMWHCVLSAGMCYVTLHSVCRHVLCDIAFCLQACTMWHCILSAGSVCRHVLYDIAFCLQACASFCLISQSCQSFQYNVERVHCMWFPSAQFDVINNRTGYLFYTKYLTQVTVDYVDFQLIVGCCYVSLVISCIAYTSYRCKYLSNWVKRFLLNAVFMSHRQLRYRKRNAWIDWSKLKCRILQNIRKQHKNTCALRYRWKSW